jgi:hypothetical protein
MNRPASNLRNSSSICLEGLFIGTKIPVRVMGVLTEIRTKQIVPYKVLHRYNQTCLHSRLNGYGNNGPRKCGPLAVPRTVAILT